MAHSLKSGILPVKKVAVGLAAAWIVFAGAAPALATQTHGDPEGIYAHQMGHIFFLLSMGFMIYWLRERGLVAQTGWRYIQYGAFFFILWNIDAFVLHYLDEQAEVLEIVRVDLWKVRISSKGGGSFLPVFYFYAKLDHLLCVPAMLFLYAGLKRLLKESATETSRTAKP